MNPIFLYSKFTALVLKSAGWTQRLNELYVNGMQFSEIFFLDDFSLLTLRDPRLGVQNRATFPAQ